MTFNMEICNSNRINTTTLITVDSNTSSVANLIDRNVDTNYITENYSGATSTTLVVTFPTATAISRIALGNHNIKDFSIFYDGTITNTFVLDSAYSTSTIDYTANSQTSHFWAFSTVTVSSVHIKMNEAMAVAEKQIAELYIGDKLHRFTQNPSSEDYESQIVEKNFIHRMSDGGAVRYFLADKFSANIQIPFISSADRSSFNTIYKTREELQFFPFPSEDNWDGAMYEVNWVNGFDFLKLTSNIENNGFTGVIQFMETPSK